MIDTNKLRYREISGRSEAYDTVKKIREDFWAKVSNGTAKREDVVNHILAIDNAGYETIPQSIGMDWIHKNTDAFRAVVGDMDEFVQNIVEVADWARDLAECAGDRVHPTIAAGLELGCKFFPSFILNWRLLRLLSPAMRSRFVREFYPRWGTVNNLWITSAIQTGVPREVIANAIIQRLRAVEVREGMTNDVNDFLHHGAGDHNDQAAVIVTMRRLGIEPASREEIEEINEDPTQGLDKIEKAVQDHEIAVAFGEPWDKTFAPCWINPDADRSPEAMWSYHFAEIHPWGVLSRHELVEALEICAGKCHGATINVMDSEYASRRFTDADRVRIVQAAILNMTNLDGVNVQSLTKRLKLWDRVKLAEQITVHENGHGAKPLAQFLFQIVVDLQQEKCNGFWEQTVKPLLENVDAGTCYRAWRQLKLENADIEFKLKQWLELDNVWMGVIQCLPHPKGGTQKGVKVADEIFVQALDAHRYYPQDGEQVLYEPLKGTRLTPTVTAVYFTPVMQDIK